MSGSNLFMEVQVARYVVEQTFPDGLTTPVTNAGAGVTWVHFYVSDDKKKTFCIYDGTDPESTRRAAGGSDLAIDSITTVRVLDPDLYK